MSGPDYGMVDAYRENINKVMDKPSDRKEFVRNWAERTGTSFEIAWHEFCTNEMAAKFFAIDPRRQNKHEKIASAWIKQIPTIKNFKKLPSKGPGSLYLKDGRILKPEDKTNDENPKSIDFVWTIEFDKVQSLSFYASHKHTDENGGSQDNQYADLKEFTREAACLTKERGYRLLSLADGFYYQQKRSTNTCYIDELKKMLSLTTFAEAMSCAELPAYLAIQITGMYERAGLSIPLDVVDLQNKIRAY